MRHFAGPKKKPPRKWAPSLEISRFPALAICSKMASDYSLQYYPAPLARLLEELMKLPGIGIKSAQRMAFHFLRMPADEQTALADAISSLKDLIRHCSICWNYTD